MASFLVTHPGICSALRGFRHGSRDKLCSPAGVQRTPLLEKATVNEPPTTDLYCFCRRKIGFNERLPPRGGSRRSRVEEYACSIKFNNSMPRKTPSTATAVPLPREGGLGDITHKIILLAAGRELFVKSTNSAICVIHRSAIQIWFFDRFLQKIPKFSFFYFSIGVLNWAVFAQCQQIAYFRVSDFVKIEKIFGRISFC